MKEGGEGGEETLLTKHATDDGELFCVGGKTNWRVYNDVRIHVVRERTGCEELGATAWLVVAVKA